ncbi:MAG: hypothetical protein MPEBLZ_03815 [Candidatus Methanoperedens nitroreducens]|uniref:Uncharacterized protein n=1 Tax=Candidatus Methanoperedens nitratireducens TaxID=1392998 RepID=A0A0N8KQB0_9EURY|nr:MAG: hypothetical protein MPEBLZ_03815 [Candidatus Methanoperedens sp. BLZ1]
MGLMKIMDEVNKLTLDRLNIGMRIAYGFIVVNILWLVVVYFGYYHERIITFMDTDEIIIILPFFNNHVIYTHLHWIDTFHYEAIK